MRRREFIALLGSAVTWPLVARAQQSALPVIGYLDSRASGDAPQRLAAVLQGFTGFVDGKNVAIVAVMHNTAFIRCGTVRSSV